MPAGEWSPASAPATLAVIPVAAPAPPTSVTASAVAGGTQLTVTHPDAAGLVGTALGAYRFEVYRTSPAARPVKLALGFTRGPGNTFVATDAGAPAQSRWAVRVVDPIGRASEAVVSNEV